MPNINKVRNFKRKIIQISSQMAEGDIRDTFHRTEIPELYDDLQSISYNTEHDPPLHNTELKGIPNFILLRRQSVEVGNKCLELR